MQPLDDFNPPVGIAQELAPGLRRVLAPNPSPMTYRGTNTYLIGTAEIAVVDPGPDDPSHLQAILAAVTADQKITHILVTHAHVDHSPLARRLSLATGAPILAYGDAFAGQSDIMRELAGQGLAGGGEGVDADFSPDICLADGEVVQVGDNQITALWTPGHFGNHLCFACGDYVLTGDLVMGWASSLVSPPDGDLTDFMNSCRRLLNHPAKVFHSGHGAPITDPQGRLNWLIEHRKSRESEILGQLAIAPGTARALAGNIYTETPAALMGAATRNVFAHLVDLYQEQKVSAKPRLSADAVFHLNAVGK